MDLPPEEVNEKKPPDNEAHLTAPGSALASSGNGSVVPSNKITPVDDRKGEGDDLIISKEDTAASPEDSLERKEYLKVIEQTTPFWITKLLGTKKLWILILFLLLFYVLCIVLVVTFELYSLDDIISEDFFAGGSKQTNRRFVFIQL